MLKKKRKIKSGEDSEIPVLIFLPMIWNGLKNYFKCLIFVFVPLGCIFLGFLVGAGYFIEDMTALSARVQEGILQIVPSIENKIDGLGNFILSSIGELRGMGLSDALKTILNTDWLTARIGEFSGLTAEEFAAVASEIRQLVSDSVSTLLESAKKVVVWAVLGVFVGYFVANLCVRHKTVRGGLAKFLLKTLIDTLFSTLIVFLNSWIGLVWQPGVVISSLISTVLFGLIALVEAYLIHGRKLKFRAVVNVKNFFTAQLSQLCIYAVTAVIIVLVFCIFHVLAAIVLAISLLQIALLVIAANADSYVSSLALRAERNASLTE